MSDEWCGQPAAHFGEVSGRITTVPAWMPVEFCGRHSRRLVLLTGIGVEALGMRDHVVGSAGVIFLGEIERPDRMAPVVTLSAADKSQVAADNRPSMHGGDMDGILERLGAVDGFSGFGHADQLQSAHLQVAVCLLQLVLGRSTDVDFQRQLVVAGGQGFGLINGSLGKMNGHRQQDADNDACQQYPCCDQRLFGEQGRLCWCHVDPEGGTE